MWIADCGFARWCRVWILIWALAGAAFAQSSVDGAIGGRVLDQRGDSVVGARVSVKSAATGDSRTAVSGGDGSFLVARVVPGVYEVVIAAPGFRVVAEEVTVELGAVANADARLTVEQVMTMLSVEAAPVSIAGAAPVPEVSTPAATEVQGGSGTTGSVTTAEEVELLPVDGRRWQTFAMLLPGANGGSAEDGEAAVSFRGLAVTQNASEIDGVSDEQSFGSVARGTGGGAGARVRNPVMRAARPGWEVMGHGHSTEGTRGRRIRSRRERCRSSGFGRGSIRRWMAMRRAG